MLIKNGFRKGDLVGINLPNIPEYVIAWLGALKAGCVVSGVSPLLSAEEMEYQLGLQREGPGHAGRHLCRPVKRDSEYAAWSSSSWSPRASAGSCRDSRGRWESPRKKFPKGKVTPLEGKTVYRWMDVIKKRHSPTGTPASKSRPMMSPISSTLAAPPGCRRARC